MAQFTLGLTKTAVEGTLSLVKSAIEEEKKLREKVQNDLVFITGEFEVMQCFLQEANREHATNDKVALALVRQLRTLAFDVEDCVEYVVHLDLDKSSHWGWLRRLWQTVNCRAPPLPLDVAVAEIKQLKARVEDVSQRNTRYHSLSLHGFDKQQPPPAVTVMPLPAEELPYASTYYPSTAVSFHALRDAWKATGKWSSNVCNLQQELSIAREGDHDLRVISFWGSAGGTGGGGGGGAGHGMVSILTKAYCDPEICKDFKIRVWMKLTHPFNHDEFIKSLLDQFYANKSHQANNVCADFCAWMKADNLTKATNLMQQMSEQRYLVVLEDVLTVAEWDVIRTYLPDNKNGSPVLLSTPHLAIAIQCTGEPYQVSELRNFSKDNQFLCAFSKKQETPREIGKFVRQLLRGHGVISVWGASDDDKPNLIDILYMGIINGWLEEIEGVADKLDHVDMLYKGTRNCRRNFEPWHSSWVDVPDPFDRKIFAQRLFLNFHSDDIRANKITKVGMMGEAGLIQWCSEFLLSEEEAEDDRPCIVVINGLRSKDEWDLIERTFFPSSEVAKAPRGCILVITEEETVATHCVKHDTNLALNAHDLKADPSIDALIKRGCWHYAVRGKKGRLFYDRRKDAREWANQFKAVGGIDFDEGKDEKEGFSLFMVNSEEVVLRHAYYSSLLFQQQRLIGRRRSWVDMPRHKYNPFWGADLNLTDFYWRLLLDFYSDDPQAKEKIAVGLMEGIITDPIQKCREFLRNEKCLVVINGLDPVCGVKDWDQIKKDLFSQQHIQSIIIVGLIGLKKFNRYAANDKLLPLGTQEQFLMVTVYRRIFSTRKRYQDAIQWFETREPIKRDREVEHIMNSVLHHNDNGLVSVWGISGVGKSALIRTFYYTDILYSSGLESPYKFYRTPTEAFAWVDVPSPFNLTDFAWRLFSDFYYDDPQAKGAATISMMREGRQVPILECCKILHAGKYMVVLDGLRSKQDWDVIKDTFLSETIQGNIIVITNEEEVAMHVNRKTINITGLEANAALSLFELIALIGGRSISMELAKSIVPKCGGLPKVIAAIGACDLLTLDSLSPNFMGTLESNPKFHGLRPLFSWMQSYFDACSDSIKPCIFYLSIFPPAETKSIRRRHLLWRWIAEGYCRDTSDGTTYDENGEKSISELVKLSIIISRPENKVLCEINGFFYEYIISRPMEDNLVFSLEEGCSLDSTRAGQHLTIRSSWDRKDRLVYESIDFSRLRSLTVFGKWESFFICSEQVNMRLLRVLDLEDAEGVTNEDLKQITKRLTSSLVTLSRCRRVLRRRRTRWE